MTVILFQRVKSNMGQRNENQSLYPLIELFGIYKMFKIFNHSDVGIYLIHVKFYCYMVLKQIRH